MCAAKTSHQLCPRHILILRVGQLLNPPAVLDQIALFRPRRSGACDDSDKSLIEEVTDDSMWVAEGPWNAVWATFSDRVGAPECAQINIHDHWLRMLIYEGLPSTFWGIFCGQGRGAGARLDQHPRPLAADVDWGARHRGQQGLSTAVADVRLSPPGHV